MLTVLKRGYQAFYLSSSPEKKVRIAQTTLAKWRRTEGPASFLADMITLRKTLFLCYNCGKFKLGRNWRGVFDYEELTTFHGNSRCDYCREDGPVTLYLAADGKVWQEHEKSTRQIAETRKREQILYNKDRRFFIGV